MVRIAVILAAFLLLPVCMSLVVFATDVGYGGLFVKLTDLPAGLRDMEISSQLFRLSIALSVFRLDLDLSVLPNLFIAGNAVDLLIFMPFLNGKIELFPLEVSLGGTIPIVFINRILNPITKGALNLPIGAYTPLPLLLIKIGITIIVDQLSLWGEIGKATNLNSISLRLPNYVTIGIGIRF